MAQDEFEKLRARLEEQLRMDIEMLYEAHRVKLRAFETIRRAQAELEGQEIPLETPVSRTERRPVLTLPAAAPAPPAPEKARTEAWSVLNGVEEALAQLPEEFDKNDLVRALGYEPSRATLFRAFDTLRAEGIIQLVSQGSGRHPSRFRKLRGVATTAPGNTTETEPASESGSRKHNRRLVSRYRAGVSSYHCFMSGCHRGLKRYQSAAERSQPSVSVPRSDASGSHRAGSVSLQLVSGSRRVVSRSRAGMKGSPPLRRRP